MERDRISGWRCACVLALLLGLATAVEAQQPTLVFSIKSIDELLDDADFVGELVGQENVREQAEEVAKGATTGLGLAGIDLEKPLGVYSFQVEEDEPEMPVVFLPISDEKKFKELVKVFAPDLEVKDGEWSLDVAGTALVGKMSNGYLFVSNSEDNLEKLPDVKKIANTRYDLALDVNLAAIPQHLKDTFLQQVETQAAAEMEKDEKPENEAEAAGREFGFKTTLAAMKAVTNDGNIITFGIDVDSDLKKATFDLGLTGKPDSSLAKAFDAYGQTKPAFAGVGYGTAPLQLLWSHPTTGADTTGLFNSMKSVAAQQIDKDDDLKTDEDRKVAKDVANRLFDIMASTIESGSIHSVLVMEKGDEETVRMMAGLKLAKGGDAAKLLDDVLKLDKEIDKASVKVDVAKHAGVRIHEVTSEADGDADKIFGKAPGHLAVGEDSLWLSLGGDNLSGLKTALDQTHKAPPKAVSPISLRAKPALLMTLLEEDEDKAKKAQTLAGKPGDSLIVEIAPSEAGIKFHVEFGLELLKLANDDEE